MAQEPLFVFLERVWYLPVVPTEPAEFMNKGQGFLLTSVPLQERCRALVALTQELVGFLVLFGDKVFLVFLMEFQLCRKDLPRFEYVLLNPL